MTAEPKAEHWLDMLELVREYGDAAAEYAFHRGNGCIPTRLLDMARERLVMAGSALRGAILDAAGDPVGDTVRGDVASLIRSLHERAQQAEATRDAAQARATACEERARRAEQQASDAAALLIAAERQLAEWRGAAMYAANTIHQADDQGTWAAAHFVLCAWADTAVEMAIDPSAGTGDHEREPGRNDVNG